MVDRWAEWSGTVIDDWPADDTRPSTDDPRIATHIHDTIDTGRAVDRRGTRS